MQQQKGRYGTPQAIYKEAENALCSNCGAQLPTSPSSRHGHVVACFECLTFNDQSEPSTLDRLTKNGKTLTTPDGLDIIAVDDQLDIRYSHFKAAPKASIAFLTFFNLVWNGIIFVIAYNAFNAGEMVPLLFMSLHILSGIVIFLAWARQILNYTDVLVREGYIEIGTGPIKNPFARPLVLESSDIKQLFTTRKLRGSTNGSPNYNYELWAVRYDRGKVKLTALASYENVLYIERSIEKFLNIKDQAIHGEYER